MIIENNSWLTFGGWTGWKNNSKAKYSYNCIKSIRCLEDIGDYLEQMVVTKFVNAIYQQNTFFLENISIGARSRKSIIIHLHHAKHLLASSLHLSSLPLHCQKESKIQCRQIHKFMNTFSVYLSYIWYLQWGASPSWCFITTMEKCKNWW